MLTARYTAQAQIVRVVEQGVGGETTHQGADRLPDALDAVRPDVLLLEEGVNDLAAGDPSAIPPMIDALEDMVREAKSRGIRVFLGTLMPERPGTSKTRAHPLIAGANAQIRLLATREGATLVDLYEGFGGSPDPYIGEDGLHPNALGYQKMAEIFFDAIRANLEVSQQAVSLDPIRPERAAMVIPSHAHPSCGSQRARAAVSLVAACSGSPAVPPPVVNNTPPTIESVTIAGTRAEADQDIQVTASVKDTETPVDQLTYTWSAMPRGGTFTGSGASVTWRPPKGQKTPDLYTITLTVTETFTSAGQARRTRRLAFTTVHYNDSPAEVAYLATDFLVAKFGNYTVSPAEAVSNFSDNCSGKAAELNEIRINREKFQILSATYPMNSISFDNAMTLATVEGDSASSRTSDRRRWTEGTGVTGICTLTNVYENFRWFLCSSTLRAPSKIPLSHSAGSRARPAASRSDVGRVYPAAEPCRA